MKETLKTLGVTASIISSVGSLVTFNDYSRSVFMETVFDIKPTPQIEKAADFEIEKLKKEAEQAKLAEKVANLEMESFKAKQEKAEAEAEQLRKQSAILTETLPQPIQNISVAENSNPNLEIARLRQEANQAKLEAEQLRLKLEKEKTNKLEDEFLQAKREKLIIKDTTKTNSIEPTPQSMIGQLIAIASKNGGLNNELEIQELTNKIDSIPKLLKGNSKEARKSNDKGLLALSNNEDFDNAVRFFSEAQKLDPADVEILNNLGFAYMKQQNFDMAEKTLIETLVLSPNRSSAWSNLGDVFALKDNESKAIACYANTYRFSKNKVNTHQFMKKVNFEEEVPFVEDVRGKAIVWAKNAYQLN